MEGTLKKGGWTRHARFARKIPEANQGKSTSWEDMFMLLVWRRPILETFSPGFFLDELDGNGWLLLLLLSRLTCFLAIDVCVI